VYPINHSGEFAVDTTSKEIQWEIPNKVLNLARSNIECLVKVENTNLKSSALTNCGAPIDRISLFSREGVYLADVPNFQQYSRALTPYISKSSDSEQNDAIPAIFGTNNDNALDTRLNKSSVPFNSAGSASRRVSSGGNALIFEDELYKPRPAIDNYITVGAAAGFTGYRVRLPLSEIHNTLLSVDRVMYFGQSIMLRVHFAPLKGWGFSYDTGSDANLAGVANLTSVTVSDIKLNLSVETSPDVIEGLVARVQSQGLQVMTPYPYGYLHTSNVGTNLSIQQRINAGHGQRLTHVVIGQFDSGVRKDTSALLDLDNQDETTSATTKVKRFQTSIDNNNLTEYVVDCEKGEDYEIMKPLLKGSTVCTSDDFRQNRIHVDSWRAGAMSSWKERDASEVDGLSLESERIYNYNVEEQASASYRVFSWFVTQRTLTIQPNGQLVMA
jgi:hypothetical protein